MLSRTARARLEKLGIKRRSISEGRIGSGKENKNAWKGGSYISNGYRMIYVGTINGISRYKSRTYLSYGKEIR